MGSSWAAVHTMGGFFVRAGRREVGGAGARGAGFFARAVNADVTEPLAFVAADGLFDVLVRGGEVVADVDSFDQEGIGSF